MHECHRHAFHYIFIVLLAPKKTPDNVQFVQFEQSLKSAARHCQGQRDVPKENTVRFTFSVSLTVSSCVRAQMGAIGGGGGAGGEIRGRKFRVCMCVACMNASDCGYVWVHLCMCVWWGKDVSVCGCVCVCVCAHV